MADASFFDWLRKKKQEWSKNPRARLTQAEVDAANASLSPVKPTTAPVTTVSATDTLGSKKGPLTGIVGAVAAAVLLNFVPSQEGTEYKAYKDIAGVLTICSGDTTNVHAGLIETPEGCRQRTEMQLTAHARGMMLCTPSLAEAGREWQRAAGTDLTYNIGIGAYCRSTIDKRWDAGRWLDGCNGFIAWNKARIKGKLTPVRGLTLRRQREIQICGTNLVTGWTPDNLNERLKAIK